MIKKVKNFPALSFSDVIKNKNSDRIKELHRVIWLDKNAVKWSVCRFNYTIFLHGFILSQYIIKKYTKLCESKGEFGMGKHNDYWSFEE